MYVSKYVSKWKHKKCRISGSTFVSKNVSKLKENGNKKVLVKTTSKNIYIN